MQVNFIEVDTDPFACIAGEGKSVFKLSEIIFLLQSGASANLALHPGVIRKLIHQVRVFLQIFQRPSMPCCYRAAATAGEPG